MRLHGGRCRRIRPAPAGLPSRGSDDGVREFGTDREDFVALASVPCRLAFRDPCLANRMGWQANLRPRRRVLVLWYPESLHSFATEQRR